MEKKEIVSSADQIQVLEGLEAVRKRPGMYIGSTSLAGLHHCVYEIVDNSVDEALAGFCHEIHVAILPDGSIMVEDDGRGIPVGINHKTGLPAVEVVFTKLHAGGKFGGGLYKVSGGLHGVGASVVNALSERMEVQIYHEGSIYQQAYERGRVLYPLKVVGSCDDDKTGTRVTFYPDRMIFDSVEFDYSIIRDRMQEMAFLTKGLLIDLCDMRSGQERSDWFKYDGGIQEFVKHLGDGKKPLYDMPAYMEGSDNNILVEVSFWHNEGYSEQCLGFVNNVSTPEGGMHIAGFRNALTKVFNDYARKNKLLKDSDQNLTGDDLREGMIAVVSIKIEDPQFEGQTKQKLGNASARSAVNNVFSEQLEIYLEQHPTEAKAILGKAVMAQKARDAARKARDLTRRKNALEVSMLPGKLADCTSKNADECEIFIVEGDSAGGSAKTARNRKTQAVLPLRGKILNVFKAQMGKIYANEEIKTMITAFGTGVNDSFDLSKLRYGKIIAMCDSDIDGHHINTLFMTFIYKFMPQLIETGHVYLAKPPLYKIERGKQSWYAYSDEERDEILERIGRDDKNKLQRYKGLGEMDADQLWETTMDPDSRVLLQVSMDDIDPEELEATFEMLMGDKVGPRRDFIMENAQFVKNLDI